MTALLIILIMLLAMMGVPLFLVIASIALVGFLSFASGGDSFATLVEPLRNVISQDIFLAIPLFTFAGFLMASAGTPRRFVNFTRSLLGWMPGGIAIVALIACAFFTAFTGASGVTIIAMGGLLFPILLKERYPENFSLGLMTTGGSRGLIFPPSLPLILYATIAAMTFSPIMEEKRAGGPPEDFLVAEAPANVGGAKAEAEDVDDELEALLGDDEDAGEDDDAELEALLGDDEEVDEDDAELEALLGDDDDGGEVATAVAAAPRVRVDPAFALYGVTELAQKAVAGDSDARDRFWLKLVDLESRHQPTPEKLFVAGAIPGGIMVIAIAVYAIFIGWRRKVPRTPFRARAVVTSFIEILAEAPIPFLIIVGIYGGFFTAQEAAGVTAFYVLIVEVFIYRDISLKRLPKVMLDSMVLVGGVMIILISALALKDYLVLAEVPQALRDALTATIDDRLTFLLLLNLFLLVVGCLMDIFSAIMVVVPLIVPLAVAYDVHPVHLGVIFLTNLEIGYSTPPVGINLFIASLRFRRPVVQLYTACLPFLGILLGGLLMITYWEDLSLWLMHATGME